MHNLYMYMDGDLSCCSWNPSFPLRGLRLRAERQPAAVLTPPAAFPALPLVSFFLLFQTAVVLVSSVLVRDFNPASVAIATPWTHRRCVQAWPSSPSSWRPLTSAGAELLQGLFHHFCLPLRGIPSSPRAFSCDHLTWSRRPSRCICPDDIRMSPWWSPEDVDQRVGVTLAPSICGRRNTQT